MLKGRVKGIYLRGRTYWLAKQVNGRRSFVSLETEDYVAAVQRAREIMDSPELQPAQSFTAEVERFLKHKFETNRYSKMSAESKRSCLAAATLMPTTYIEPGGNVAIESMACGTPVITPDAGVFTETVPQEFRFRTFRKALDAVENAKRANHASLKNLARKNYSFDAIRPKFQAWFRQLATLFNNGWYEI